MHKRAFMTAISVAVTVVLLCFSAVAFAADGEVSVSVDGEIVDFDSTPVIVDDVTMVEVRPLAEALGCSVKWSQNTQSVKLTKGNIGVVIKMDWDVMTKTDLSGNDDGDLEQIQLAAVPNSVDGVAYVPLRGVAEAFGADIEWNEDDDVIEVSTANKRVFRTEVAAAPAEDDGHTFYFQNQSDWQLPNFGSGYCWTCSYAMLISDVTGETVTPCDVAAINEEECGDGAYCYHWNIADAFGVKFVSALDEDSPYYGGRDSNSGGTLIENPDDDESVVIEALKEAIDRNPAGVMVRYGSYPHTMVAVAYEGDTIYFNEPMQLSRSEYYDESPKHGVPFEETCIAKRGIGIKEISFMQALEVE